MVDADEVFSISIDAGLDKDNLIKPLCSIDYLSSKAGSMTRLNMEFHGSL